MTYHWTDNIQQELLSYRELHDNLFGILDSLKLYEYDEDAIFGFKCTQCQQMGHEIEEIEHSIQCIVPKIEEIKDMI